VPVSDPEDGAIEGFAIAGDDRHFQPADVAYRVVGKDDRGQPKYDQRQLVLTSPLVPAPQHFRYAWGRNPLRTLQASGNKDLPFPAQRSDDWDMNDVPLGVLGADRGGTAPMTGAQRQTVLRALRRDDARRRVAEAKAVLRELGDAVGEERQPGK